MVLKIKMKQESIAVVYVVLGLIVAITGDELPRLEKIYERGQANGINCQMIDVDRLRATKGPGLGRVGELLWNCAPNTP